MNYYNDKIYWQKYQENWVEQDEPFWNLKTTAEHCDLRYSECNMVKVIPINKACGIDRIMRPLENFRFENSIHYLEPYSLGYRLTQVNQNHLEYYNCANHLTYSKSTMLDKSKKQTILIETSTGGMFAYSVTSENRKTCATITSNLINSSDVETIPCIPKIKLLGELKFQFTNNLNSPLDSISVPVICIQKKQLMSRIRKSFYAFTNDKLAGGGNLIITFLRTFTEYITQVNLVGESENLKIEKPGIFGKDQFIVKWINEKSVALASSMHLS